MIKKIILFLLLLIFLSLSDLPDKLQNGIQYQDM